MHQGYISLHRKLTENKIWGDANYIKLWLTCLFKASHKEHEQLLGNQTIILKRGQFITGRKALSELMNKGVKPDQQLSEKTWYRYMQNLEKWEMLTIEVTNKFSVVTIVNYDVYQGPGAGFVQVIDQQKTDQKPEPKKEKPDDKSIELFDEFWDIYSKKADKKKAYEKFKAKLKQHSFEQIIEGAKKYMLKCQIEQTDKKFIKNATTFLNGDCFLEDFEIYGGPIKRTGPGSKGNGVDFDKLRGMLDDE